MVSSGYRQQTQKSVSNLNFGNYGTARSFSLLLDLFYDKRIFHDLLILTDITFLANLLHKLQNCIKVNINVIPNKRRMGCYVNRLTCRLVLLADQYIYCLTKIDSILCIFILIYTRPQIQL